MEEETETGAGDGQDVGDAAADGVAEGNPGSGGEPSGGATPGEGVDGGDGSPDGAAAPADGTVEGAPSEGPDDAGVEASLEDWTNSEVMQALDAELEAQGVKAWSIRPEVLQEMPPEAQQQVHNVIRMVQRKANQFSEAAKGAAEKEAALAAEERRLAAQAVQLQEFATNPAIQSIVQKYGLQPGERTPDPDTARGREVQYATLWKESMEKMAEAIESNQAALQQQETTHQHEVQRLQAVSFMDQHPDDFREGTQIRELIEVYFKGDESLTLEQAHAKAKAVLGAEVQQASLRAQDLSRPSNGGGPLPRLPEHIEHGADSAAWFERNPDAQRAVLTNAESKGTGY